MWRTGIRRDFGFADQSRVGFKFYLLTAVFALLFLQPAPTFGQEDETPIGEEDVTPGGPEEIPEADPLAFEITDYAKIRPVLFGEVKHLSERNFDNERTSDFPVTVNGGFELEIYDWFFATSVLELGVDQDTAALIVDEAFVQLGNEENIPIFLRAGYYTSPFGNFDSRHIEDPLTTEAFEVKGDVVEVFYGVEEELKVGLFGVRGREDIVLEQLKGERPEKQNQKWRFGAGLTKRTALAEDLTLITDASVTQSIYSAGDLVVVVPDRDPRWGGSAKLGLEAGNNRVSVQYVSAFEDVTFIVETPEEAVELEDAAEDEVVPTRKAKPAALAVELTREREFEAFTGFASVGYSRSWDLQQIVPEHRMLLTVGFERPHLEVSVEYGHQWDYESEEGERADGNFFGAKVALGF